MVNRRDYEKYQLELIKAEYEAKNFEIIDEARMSSNRMVWDAIAINRRSGVAVIIEIVNAGLGGEKRPHLLDRTKFIREAITEGTLNNEFSRYFPENFSWSVDFRYIDSKEKPEQNRNISVQSNFKNDSIVKIIGEKLPKSLGNSRSEALLSRQFLSDWSITARTIRSFIAFALMGREINEESSVLDLYNIMLSQCDIVPAEQYPENKILDLFDIFENVQLVISGGHTNPKIVKELRIHLVNIRQQIRRWSKRNNRLLVIK